jgi:hypothetical protein
VTLIPELQRILGADAVLTEPRDLDGFTEDWRGRYRGPTASQSNPRYCTSFPATNASV